MCGWMYLISGTKYRELYPPRFLTAAFDPGSGQFFHPQKHSVADFPALSSAEKFVGTIGGGDLLYFPAGWIHRVETPEYQGAHG
jgi:hypothetical protein